MGDILGVPIPAVGAVFLGALAVHVVAGLVCVFCGAVAALAGKGGPRHVRFARWYLWGLVVLYGTLALMSALRWSENAHLFAVGTFTFVAALIGYLNRRRPAVHIIGMGLSYVGLLTGFYVDNGARLPLWDRLPQWSYWVLPALVGVPLIVRSVLRHRTAMKVPTPRGFGL